MSRVTERMSGNRKRVCIQDEGIGRIYIDWDDWVFFCSLCMVCQRIQKIFIRECAS
jgi:hypothetical protein